METTIIQGAPNNYQYHVEVHLRYHILKLYMEYGTKFLVTIWPLYYQLKPGDACQSAPDGYCPGGKGKPHCHLIRACSFEFRE